MIAHKATRRSIHGAVCSQQFLQPCDRASDLPAVVEVGILRGESLRGRFVAVRPKHVVQRCGNLLRTVRIHGLSRAKRGDTFRQDALFQRSQVATGSFQES